MKKMNGKMKLLLTALATLVVVDLWRDWPWVKKIAAAFTSKGESNDAT